MTAPDPKRARFPLAAQADEANRELGLRYRVYAMRVKDGRMTQAEADRGIALMRAIRDTLRLFAAYEDEVRATVAHCIERARIEAEVAELRRDPAVRAVLDVFGHDADVGPARYAADPDAGFAPDPPPFDIPENEEHAAA